MRKNRHCQNKLRCSFSFGLGLVIIFLLLGQQTQAQRLSQRKVKQIFKKSEILKTHFTGFALYSLDDNKMIYELNADKHFTPASNTKLLTFYTALEMLGDSIPALRYLTKGDSLIFWGTGDPSLLHSTLKADAVYHFLKNTTKKLFYSPNFKGNVYGNGWAWSDYNDDYQTELVALPLLNNVLMLSADKNGKMQVSPNRFKPDIRADSSFCPKEFIVERAVHENKWRYPAVMPVPAGFKQEVPLKTSVPLTIALLQDTLKKTIGVLNMPMPADARIMYNIPADSVYKAMLLPSDNFIAEQLLLVCSSTLSNTLHTDTAIAYAKKTFLKDLPNMPQWVDGSGLSRYNLITPRSMIALLKKIWTKVGDEQRLHNLLPAGGKTGTLRNAYKTDNEMPFVWAKTGTLSNNHNQSGYLVTRKGKRLMYCFMNNNFRRPTSEVRAEMVRIITAIHESY